MGGSCCRAAAPITHHGVSSPYDTRWTCGECCFTLCASGCYCCMSQQCFDNYLPIEIVEYRALVDRLSTFVNTREELEELRLYEEAYRESDSARLRANRPIATSWDDIFRELQTGDLILFRCTDTYGSYLVTAYTGEFTHIGMVIVRRDPVTRRKLLLLLESVSHSDDLFDWETNVQKSGVRQVDLYDRLSSSASHYYGVVKLRFPSPEVQAEVQRRVEEFTASEGYKDYNGSKAALLRAAFNDGVVDTPQDRQPAYFCSQLICKALQEAGISDENLNAAATIPSDFFQHDLRFKSGFTVDALYYMDKIIPATPGPDSDGETAAAPPQTQRMGGPVTRRLKHL